MSETLADVDVVHPNHISSTARSIRETSQGVEAEITSRRPQHSSQEASVGIEEPTNNDEKAPGGYSDHNFVSHFIRWLCCCSMCARRRTRRSRRRGGRHDDDSDDDDDGGGGGGEGNAFHQDPYLELNVANLKTGDVSSLN